MNWKLAVATFTLSFRVVAMAQSLVPIPITMSGPTPWIDVKAYGAQSVTFLFNAPSSETITPMGFIVEKI